MINEDGYEPLDPTKYMWGVDDVKTLSRAPLSTDIKSIISLKSQIDNMSPYKRKTNFLGN